MAFVNQGNRPNYQSSISPLTYAGRPTTLEASVNDLQRAAKHENFIGGAYRYLSVISERECFMFLYISFDSRLRLICSRL
jgi:catalase